MQGPQKNLLIYSNPLKRRFAADFFGQITQMSGVYFMMDRKGSILYIGKAKNLRNRIRSYSHLKPGTCADHTLEMLEHVNSIQWKTCESEREAFSRENELLHAIRPPFNIAHTEIEHYLFIGVRENLSNSVDRKKNSLIKLDMQLSSHERISEDGYQLYGCFKHRRKIKSGYTALLRLIFAMTLDQPRFYYPARLTRAFPPWQYTIAFPPSFIKDLHAFLNGENKNLLVQIVDRLLDSEFIPEWMRPSIQEDIEAVNLFYSVGPEFTFSLRQRIKSPRKIVLHSEMDEFFAADLKSEIT